jgi:hypothetical protein
MGFEHDGLVSELLELVGGAQPARPAPTMITFFA